MKHFKVLQSAPAWAHVVLFGSAMATLVALRYISPGANKGPRSHRIVDRSSKCRRMSGRTGHKRIGLRESSLS